VTTSVELRQSPARVLRSNGLHIQVLCTQFPMRIMPVLSPHLPADDLSMWSVLASQDVLGRLQTQTHGLTQEAAAQRLREHGLNRVANGHHEAVLSELVRRSVNPLNVLLISLAGVSAVLGDIRAAVLIAVMVVLSVVLGFLQEHRSNRAAEALRRMVHTTAR